MELTSLQQVIDVSLLGAAMLWWPLASAGYHMCQAQVSGASSSQVEPPLIAAAAVQIMCFVPEAAQRLGEGVDLGEKHATNPAHRIC